MFNNVSREDNIKEAVFKDGSIDITKNDVDIVVDIFFDKVFTAVDAGIINGIFVVAKSVKHGSVCASDV